MSKSDAPGAMPRTNERATASEPQQFALWQLYALLGMMAAAAAVWVSHNTHPLALVLLSAAALAAAFVALALHQAAAALLSRADEAAPLGERRRAMLGREKALILRSIKELEFDKAMGKIGEADFAAMSSRLRARALALMQDLARAPAGQESATGAGAAPAVARRKCPACGTHNDREARFCKNCGRAMGQSS